MLGSQVLEVVIGLVMVYLVLSIGCSGIKEVLASLFSLRAKTLESTIRKMLKDGPIDYTTKLYAHPLVAASAPEGQKPSYISARSFALALFDVIAPSTQQQALTPDSLRAGVAQISEEKLRNTLLGFIDSAGGDMDAARQKVEHWFDDTMERISGWYKRMAQKIIFVAGLILCIALNGDTLMVVKELWSDQAVRSAVVANAEKKVKQGNPGETSGPSLSLAEVNSEIRNANSPPIGWSSDPNEIRAWPKDLWGQAYKVFGILFTAFAITLGSPFWFDLLNKIINLRLTGNPPNPSA